MKFLKFAHVVLGHDDEPIRASFDEGKIEKRAGSTAEVFLTILDSYRPETKLVLSAAEIDNRNDARRVLRKAVDGEGYEMLRGEPYIRLDNEHFAILAKITREIGPIILQLWDQTPHLLRVLGAALDEKVWDREQKAAVAELEARTKTKDEGAR